MLRTPELNAVLQGEVFQEWCRGAESSLLIYLSHCFWCSPGCGWLLGWKGTVLAHVQLSIHQQPQAFHLRAALNSFSSQSVCVLGIVPTQVQDLALGLHGPTSGLSRSLWVEFLPFSICWPCHVAWWCWQTCWGRTRSHHLCHQQRCLSIPVAAPEEHYLSLVSTWILSCWLQLFKGWSFSQFLITEWSIHQVHVFPV